MRLESNRNHSANSSAPIAKEGKSGHSALSEIGTAHSSNMSLSHIMQLQRAVGNQAVSRLLQSRTQTPSSHPNNGKPIQRTREDAVKAGIHFDRDKIVNEIKDTNINGHFRLTLLLINNYELDPSHEDYIPIDAVSFPDLSSEVIQNELSKDITKDYYFKRARPELQSFGVMKPQERKEEKSPDRSGLDGRPDKGSISLLTDESLEEQLMEPSSIPEISSKDFEVLQIFDAGSTKPQKVRMKNGDMKVLKYGKDEGHLLTEVLSNKLYKEAGIPTLEVDIIRVDGKLAQIADFIDNFKEPSIDELSISDDFLRHIGADMLFANWDLFKTANWMQIGGRMVRSDNGGALDRKAQGQLKDPKDWNGDEVNDFKSMKEKGNSPYSRVTEHEIADSVRTLAFQLTPDKIDKAMEESNYPIPLRKAMKETILSRIGVGLEFANRVYEMDATIHVDHAWDDGRELAVEDLGPEDVLGQMSMNGWTNVPDVYDPELIGELIRAGIMQPPEPKGKTGNPHESIPMVGPEELTREDQFGKGLNVEMAQYFSRIKTGRLVRRMSDKEREAFENAAASEDINEIVNLIFPSSGNPGARGEMVWAVNEPFIFDREKAAQKGEQYNGNEEPHDPKDYHWIMEIYITDKMLEFLQDYCYINNPTGGGKPSAFMGNPTLKKEGGAGGRGGEGGIPNVVIKKDGFAKFWRTMKSFQFVKAENHFWQHRSNNKEVLEALKDKERKEKQAEKREERKKHREKLESVDDDDYGIGNLEEFGQQ